MSRSRKDNNNGNNIKRKIKSNSNDAIVVAVAVVAIVAVGGSIKDRRRRRDTSDQNDLIDGTTTTTTNSSLRSTDLELARIILLLRSRSLRERIITSSSNREKKISSRLVCLERGMSEGERSVTTPRIGWRKLTDPGD